MIVDPDFFDHWRTQMLADALGDPLAPVYVMRIWAHCQQRKTTVFENIPAAGLKAICRASCDALQLERALIAAGFVERDGESILVPKWADHNASLVAAWKNGHLGGRPRKEPKKNPAETHGLPMANPQATQTKPIREDKSREDKQEAKASTAFAAPEWVPADAWTDFVAMRKAMRGVPFTSAAAAGVVRELEKLVAEGYDATEVLQLAVTSGWRTVYRPKSHSPPGRAGMNAQELLEASNRAVAQRFIESRRLNGTAG